MKHKDPMTIEGAKHVLLARFPEHEITAGYIGNCDPLGNNDDRSWRIWCKIPDEYTSAPKQLEVVIGSTQALPDTYGGWRSYIDRMTRLIDREYLRDLSERLRNVPVDCGVDEADCDRLLEMANDRLHLPSVGSSWNQFQHS